MTYEDIVARRERRAKIDADAACMAQAAERATGPSRRRQGRQPSPSDATRRTPHEAWQPVTLGTREHLTVQPEAITKATYDDIHRT